MPNNDKFPIYNPRGSGNKVPTNFKRPTWSYEQARNQDFVSYAKLNERKNTLENAPFMWPGPNTTNIGGVTKTLVRGFMRSILYQTIGTGNANGSSQTGIRLNFQFNPEYIQRDVSQSPGAVNPLLQSITNLTQPVPGTAQFNFTITFNREHEVAMRGDAARDSAFNFAENNDNALTLLNDPSMVGVMHDLSVFDKIIGQGISKELVSTLLRFTQKAAELNPDGDDENATAFDLKEYEKGLNKNIGNSAFLNPLPVRVVFGDLFMVEGFVTGSAVAFQKFSRQMIPTICQINCNLSALYFGFAKKSAFVTDNLEEFFKSELAKDEQDAKDTKKAEQAVANTLQKFQYVFNSSTEGVLSEDDYNLDLPDGGSDGMKIWRGTSVGQFYSGNNSGFMTMPQWFNAFSNSNITVAGNKAKQIYDVFTYGQQNSGPKLSDTLIGWTPILVVIDILNPFKENSNTTRKTQKEMPDNLADLGISVETNGDPLIKITSAGTQVTRTINIKRLIQTTPGGGGGRSRGWHSWEKVGDNSHSFSILNQWYGIAAPASSTITQYFRVFWINPVDVSDKEVINSTDDCQLIFKWEIKGTVGSSTGTVQLKEQVIPYKFNTPFISNSAANQLKKVSALSVRKGTGTGPRNVL